MEDSAADKVSVDHDCESSVVIRDKSVEYSDIQFISCKRFFIVIVSLFIVSFIVLLIEQFINYAERIVIKSHKGKRLKQLTMTQIAQTKSVNSVTRRRITK